MNIKISEVSLSILINAYSVDHDIELTESEVVAVCMQLGVRYGNSGVKAYVNVPEEQKSGIREFSTDLALILEIAKQDDDENDMLKDANQKYQEFLNIMTNIRERYNDELTEAKANVYSTIDKVLQSRTTAE